MSQTSSVQGWPPLQIPIPDLVAGSCAGAAQVIVGQPLDTVKVRSQTSTQFKGPLEIFVRTLKDEGALAFFKGMTSPLLGVAAQNSLLFTAFALAKRYVSPTSQDLSVAQVAAAGSIAGIINSVLASPVELFKIRMQVQYGSPADRKLSQVAKDLWSEHGFKRGVMRGFWVTVAREAPAYAGFYAGFEAAKRTFRTRLYPDLPKDQMLPLWCLMASGSTGGICNWLACYPLDVIKSKVQLSNTPLRGWGPTYIATEFQTIAKQEGYRAFLRGLSPTLLRSIPAAAATFTVYELTLNALTKA
ncbi:hypothetical protein CF319_g3899 [Tilletia indica]|nr:hypothetical protein CF319_g3899 [Tilletia indica]KAE8232026.1 hypothetical protein CF326_g2945 [Tilletia indica]